MSKMPDIIYAEVIELYGQRKPMHLWHESQHESNGETYYSQAKVDELLEKQLEACAEAYLGHGDTSYFIYDAIRNARIEK